jgi:uncharacterized protein (DUF2147 family)
MAQDNAHLALDIANAQEKNRAQLMNYSWQRSAKAFMNEEEKVHTLVKVWFNTEGKMESSVLSSQSSGKQARGIRGRAQQNAGEDMLALIEHSINMSIKYVYLSKGNWIDLVDMAEVKVDGGVVKIDAKDLLVKGDEVHYSIDDSTKLFKSIKVTSPADEKTFTSSIDFKIMSDGTNHPSHTEIMIPSESLKILVENIDYIKQQ